MTARRWPFLLVLAATLAVSGCGLTEDDEEDPTETAQQQTDTAPAPPRRLPQRPRNVVAVDGETSGSLTPAAVERFRRTGTPSVTVTVGDSGNSAAFQRLCRGQIDVVDASRAISRSERRLCSRNGVGFIELQAASEAVVLATKNERDVGADCLTIRQVRDVFEAGSLVSNWQDLNPVFFDLKLTPTGPDEDSNEFDFFGTVVLRARGDATLSELTDRYIPHRDPDEVREEVADNPPGVIGIFRFSYYEQFEEQLRPLELDNGRGNRCVFPSQDTVTSGLFPLSRRLLLYSSRQALKRKAVKDFLTLYLQRAPDLATGSRLVPLPLPVQADQLRKIGVREVPRPASEAEEPEFEGGVEGDDTFGTEPEGTGTESEGGAGGGLSFEP